MGTPAREVVAFEALPVQDQLWHAVESPDKRIIGFGGGIRGTKTWGTLATLIALCRIYPRSRWHVIRKDLERLKDSTLPSFEKLAERFGSFVGKVNRQDWYARCRNGSEIHFTGENIDRDPELQRFHGFETNGFLLDDGDELAERTLVKCIERAGTWIVPDGEQPPPYIFATFNPCPGWPKRRFYIPWRDGHLVAPYAFIPATAADNPYITPEQRDAWRSMPTAEYNRFVLSDWESMAGNYYDTLTIDVLCDPLEELPSHWRYWGSFDWGYRHWAVMGAWATDEQGVDYLLDSVWLRRVADDDEMALEFLKTLPRRCLQTVYAGEDVRAKVRAHSASGETVQDVFGKRGIGLVIADTDKVNGGRAVNRQLKQGGVKICKTPGNLRGYDQLQEIMPDPDDVRKPLKVDCDPESGLGGDDWADMFRYGIATRVRNAVRPVEPEAKTPHRAHPMVVKDGKLVKPEPVPKTVEEIVEWYAKRGERTRVPHFREGQSRVPRRRS